MSEKVAMIGVACPRFMSVEVVRGIIKWAESSKQYRVLIDWEPTPDRLDWSYSRIFEDFLQSPAEFLVLNDADVLTEELTFDQAAFAFRKDVKAGFGVAASPCMNVEGRFIMDPEPPEPCPEEAWEVRFVTGGQYWLTREAVQKLPIGGWLETHDGTKDPMRVFTPPTDTVDAEKCRIFRSQGIRICADPNLRTMHYKLRGLPSYRPGLVVEKYHGA